MARQIIDIGSGYDANDGDIERDAWDKANDNFAELFAGAIFEGFLQTTEGRAAFSAFFVQWMSNLPTTPAAAGVGGVYNAGGIPAIATE